MASATRNSGTCSIECPVCLGPITQPVISSCCSKHFCSGCIRRLQPPDRCPYCRSDRQSTVRPAPTPPHHPQQTAPSYRCQATGCSFSSGSGDALLRHLVDRHSEHLLRFHHLMFPQNLGDTATGGGDWQQRECPTTLADIRDPQLGSNRKMYCGGRLNGPPCGCCNGFCGPESGCNCAHCMTLDLVNFEVTQGNSLVNKFGQVASRSSETGKFYCAAVLNCDEYGSLTYCGPIEGPNCEACAALDSQWEGRYASLM